MSSTSRGTSPGLYLIGGLAALKSTTFLTGLRDLVLFPIKNSSASLLLILPSPWWRLMLVSCVEMAVSDRAHEDMLMSSSAATDERGSISGSKAGGGRGGVCDRPAAFMCRL
jgi:hypothetical protein